MYGILLLFLNIPGNLGCGSGGGGGGGYYNYDYYTTAKISTKRSRRSTTPKGDAVDRNLPLAWGGFRPSAQEEAVWRTWLSKYNENKKNEQNDDPSKYVNERGPGSGWPSNFLGLGAGSSGVAPPPWAYVPINTGLPAFCYQPPLAGNCTEKETRWAFNPFTAECVKFDYTGCGGNQNNFLTMVKCEQSCMKMPVNGCDPKKKQFVEYMMPT